MAEAFIDLLEALLQLHDLEGLLVAAAVGLVAQLAYLLLVAVHLSRQLYLFSLQVANFLLVLSTQACQFLSFLLEEVASH